MESPITILITKISGTLVYLGFGQDNIEPRSSDVTSRPFEHFLDNEESNPSTLYYLPNGNLCIYTCIGDEQPSSQLMIIQDWRIEHVPHNLPIMEKQNFAKLFINKYSLSEVSVPEILKYLFNEP